MHKEEYDFLITKILFIDQIHQNLFLTDIFILIDEQKMNIINKFNNELEFQLNFGELLFQ